MGFDLKMTLGISCCESIYLDNIAIGQTWKKARTRGHCPWKFLRIVEIFENCGNFLTVEDYAPLFSEENLFLVEMFDETFNIWHIYSL